MDDARVRCQIESLEFTGPIVNQSYKTIVLSGFTPTLYKELKYDRYQDENRFALSRRSHPWRLRGHTSHRITTFVVPPKE